MGYRAHRYIILMFAVLLVPMTMWFIAYLKTPTLYPGDRVETRSCPYCNGTGVDKQQAEDNPQLSDRCAACGGTGKVQVVMPGPNRPTHIAGRVVPSTPENESWPYSVDPATTEPSSPMGLLHPRYPGLTGAIAGATLTFHPAFGDTIETTANENGDFNADLPPGSYTLTVKADKYAAVTSNFNIHTLCAPIWLYQAHIMREPGGGSRGENGLDLIVGLGASDAGWAHLQDGSPL